MNHIFEQLQKNPAPVPCLFYPAMRALDMSIQEALTDAQKQAALLCHIAEHYPVGAVLRLTEIWPEAAAFGVKLEVRKKDFPRVGKPVLKTTDEFETVCIPDAVNPITAPLLESAEIAASKLSIPLIAGVVGPYTLASVLHGSENFMVACLTEPDVVHTLLQKLTDFLISYIAEYKKRGIAAVMIAEPSTAMASPDTMDVFSNQYLQKMIDALQDDTFSLLYHNCGNLKHEHLEILAKLPFHGFHVGSTCDMQDAAKLIPSDVLLMGNLEPQLLISGGAETVAQKVAALQASFSGLDNWRLSTGCDIAPRAADHTLAAFFGDTSVSG